MTGHPRIAILGAGGVGGFVAAALERGGLAPTLVAREETAALLRTRGLRVESVRLGEFEVAPRIVTELRERHDALVVATKAPALETALGRIEREPELVVPLLNGRDHLDVLECRFGRRVAAGSIRIEADRPRAGLIRQTSRFLRVDVSSERVAASAVAPFAATLRAAEIPTDVLASDADVVWRKLVRLNALALTTSAWDASLGAIRADARRRRALERCVEEGVAVARAEGAAVDTQTVLAELAAAHETLGSSMQRDISAGRPTELDAIAGAVLRAAARHGLACPQIAELAAAVAERSGDATIIPGRA